jgi:hypothetical protein
MSAAKQRMYSSAGMNRYQSKGRAFAAPTSSITVMMIPNTQSRADAIAAILLANFIFNIGGVFFFSQI